MKHFVVFIGLVSLSMARPEPPRSQYGAPPPPPPPAPQREYIPPHNVNTPPQFVSLPVYNAPAPFYGPPAPAAIVTKNVYVHVPPEEPEVYRQSAPIQTAPPNKHYKIIFIKAPSPPAPQRLVVPPPVQDEHKTLVYVLVKKPEEPEQLVLPAPAPTQPTKPEVYFIKYKEHHKPSDQYGPPAQPQPAGEYGPPAEKF